jgi:hypothetical protein
MAEIHNGIKYETGVLGALALAAGLSREESGVERLSESLTPIMNIWDLPEWAILRGELLLGRGILSPAGGAATFAGGSVLNPAGSGKIAVITHCTASVPAVAEIAASRDTETSINTQFGTFVTSGRRESRAASKGRCLAGFGAPATTLTGDVLYRQNVLANTVLEISELVGVVLSPGTGVFVQNALANSLIYVTFGWRERMTLPGELTAS